MDDRPFAAGHPTGSCSPARAEQWRSVATGVDVDALLAHLVGDLLLVGHRVLFQPDALLGDGALLGHDLLLVEDHLVLLLGDRRPVRGPIDVGVGDRLTLDAHLLALYRNRLLDLLGNDVLAQARAPALARGSADTQVLLGPRHGVVGGRAADVLAGVTVPHAGRGLMPAVAGGCHGALLGIGHAIVLEERDLLLLGELALGLDARRGLDLVLEHGNPDVLALRGRAGERHERPLAPEQAGVHRGPLWAFALVVEVERVDLANLLAVAGYDSP